MGSKKARGAKTHRPHNLNRRKHAFGRVKNLKIRVSELFQSILECQYEKNCANVPSLQDSKLAKNAGWEKLNKVIQSQIYPTGMLAQARYLTQLESDNKATLARLKAPFDAGDIADEVRVGTDEPLFDNQGLISDNESCHDMDSIDPGADVGNSSDEDESGGVTDNPLLDQGASSSKKHLPEL